MAFKIRTQKRILQTVPFEVQELELEFSNGEPIDRPYHRLKCNDWVNVLPIADTNKAILIEQPRVGSLSLVLETPGGIVENDECDVTLAAARELEEETGFVSKRFLPLATINPNPAIMTNKCHFFLALGCQLTDARRHFPDSEERIRVVITELQNLDQMIRTGLINHSLSALCIMLGMKYLKLD